LYWAQQRAEAIGDDGAVEDLAEIMRHLHVMLEDSLKNKPRGRRQMQLTLINRT